MRFVALSRFTAILFFLGGCAESPPRVDTTGPFVLHHSVALSQPIDATALLVGPHYLLLVDGANDVVTQWTTDGTFVGTAIPKLASPGGLAVPDSNFVLTSNDVFGILDVRSYRYSTFQLAKDGPRFLSSFLVSPFEMMAMHAFGAPTSDRIWMCAPGEPDVVAFDRRGQLLHRFDHFPPTVTTPYAHFVGTVTADGDFLYAPIARYEVARASTDGVVRPFATGRNERYHSPLPIPETIRDDLYNLEARYAWEDSVSWIHRIAFVAGRVLVSYNEPGATETRVLDVFDADGNVTAMGIASPGRLLGCDSSLARCAFLRSDAQAIDWYDVELR